jgi:hypothetical protein
MSAEPTMICALQHGSLRRTSGSHHAFAHPAVTELLNLLDVKGQAKPYQIRQFLRLVERYALSLEADK